MVGISSVWRQADIVGVKTYLAAKQLGDDNAGTALWRRGIPMPASLAFDARTRRGRRLPV